jgi:hypothetical protein
MSSRFNRNDTHVPDDRLFPDDFITDQNGQDADLLQLAKDFGCLPCLGEGLEVTEKEAVSHTIQISAGWAYDKDGHRITVESAQEASLETWDNSTNYVKIAFVSTTDTARPAHRTGVSYDTRKKDFYTITVSTDAPAVSDIVLATVRQNETNPISISLTDRIQRTCKLIPQSSIPAVAEEEGTGTGAEPPPPGQQPELPDLPKGRTVPMPIILSGTRSGEAWGGIETVMPEELGRTTAAQTAVILERVNQKTGTPLADVKIWIGDWGQGQRDGSNLKKCNFTGPTKSGALWDDNLWILGPDDTPPGPGYYYLVKHDESWYSKITGAGNNGTANWVICENDLPDAVAAEYYVCPYAERYESQSQAYETDVTVSPVHVNTTRQAIRIASPVTPMALLKGLNLGGKYKFKVASLVSGDNYTKWAEADFIVGSDLVLCWEPESANLNVVAVDGGVEITIPAKASGKADPEAYELVYTYGDTPEDPDFDNTAHPTVRIKERVQKLDVPPGQKVKVKCRAIRSRQVMQCSGSPRVLTPSDTYVVAGGVANLRNRKFFTNPISAASLATGATKVVDIQKIPNAVWPEAIMLVNLTAAAEQDFEVYVYGSNQTYDAGRKIMIGTGGDASNVPANGGSVEKDFADFKITDPGLKLTIKNIGSGTQTFDLRYTLQYREDAGSKII